MDEKTQAAYNAAQKMIGEQAQKLSKGQYADYVDELSGHLQCLQDCIDDENKEQG